MTNKYLQLVSIVNMHKRRIMQHAFAPSLMLSPVSPSLIAQASPHFAPHPWLPLAAQRKARLASLSSAAMAQETAALHAILIKSSSNLDEILTQVHGSPSSLPSLLAKAHLSRIGERALGLRSLFAFRLPLM